MRTCPDAGPQDVLHHFDDNFMPNHEVDDEILGLERDYLGKKLINILQHWQFLKTEEDHCGSLTSDRYADTSTEDLLPTCPPALDEFNLNVIVPSSLKETFVAEVEENTSQNIESLGYLYGVVEEGFNKVTTLLFPKQVGSDTHCEGIETTEELEMIRAYVEENGLVQLGWIHSHPLVR